MSEVTNAQERYKSEFLGLFPKDCQDGCIVAKIASVKVAKSYLESDLPFDKYVEHYAHRFGRCAIGPDIEGMCGKKSVCNNQLVADEENPVIAAEVLADV